MFVSKQGCYSSMVFTLHSLMTYEWAQLTNVFVLGKPFQPSVTPHSRPLGPLVSNEENEVL
jgi:hypothetical protein